MDASIKTNTIAKTSRMLLSKLAAFVFDGWFYNDISFDGG
jgi:hypothetical protein